MEHASQTRCPKCEYPFIALENFNGDSRRHTATFEEPYSTPNAWTGCDFPLLEIAVDILREIFNPVGLKLRRYRVTKMKEEILPQFPISVMCPKCLAVVKRQ